MSNTEKFEQKEDNNDTKKQLSALVKKLISRAED